MANIQTHAFDPGAKGGPIALAGAAGPLAIYGVASAQALIISPSTRWYEGQYTYSVPIAGSTWPGYLPVYGLQDPLTDPGYAVLNQLQADLFREMMEEWDELIAPNWIETDDIVAPGSIRIAISHLPVTIGGAAAAFLPPDGQVENPSTWAGDIFLADNMNTLALANPFDFNDYRRVVSHEIGHALGLQHTFTAQGYDLAYDTHRYSIMSYTEIQANLVPTWLRDAEGELTGEVIVNRIFATGPMVMDIAAIQHLYGVDPNTRSGDTTYTFEDALFMRALYDAGGVDTFDLSGDARGSIVDLTPGAYSSIGYFENNSELGSWMIQQNPDVPVHEILGYTDNSFNQGRLFLNRDNLGIAFSTVIENVIGSADHDVIIGNIASNDLNGGAGDDWLYGYEGDDILTGGAGSDFIDGGLGQNTVAFAGIMSAYTISWNGQIGTVVGADGTDTITNVAFLQFSDLTIAAGGTGGLTISGGVTDNLMVGSAFVDVFYGQMGDDTLQGFGGADVLNGGLGDDLLDGGAELDTADYSDASGTVFVNLTMGAATGAAGADTLVSVENVEGSRFDDILAGDAGANVLSGGGGRDELRGEAGDDRLVAGPAPMDAPVVNKAQATANTSREAAVDLDGYFDVVHDPEVELSTTLPHATVQAVTHGGFEYYRFTGSEGDTVVVDIDNFTNINILVAQVDVLDALGNVLDVTRSYGQDGGFGADPTVRLTLSQSGIYYVRVGSQGDENQAVPASAGASYRMNLSVSSQALADEFREGSQLYGGFGDDFLVGGSGNDLLDGGLGSDYLSGGSGSDRFVWTAVADSPTGSSFDAVADFETGVDTLDFSFDTGRAFITRAGASSFIYFGQEQSGAFGGIVQVVGTVQGFDILSGGPGVYLYGDGSAEDLQGGSGADIIVGFDGADVIAGGAGSDALYGGAGADTFVLNAVSDSDFSGYDAIGDFTSGSDKIDLAALVAAGQTNIALARFGGSTFVYFGAAGQATFSGVLVSTGEVQGTDLILGQTLGLVMYGSSANDDLRGGSGADTILAGDGADILVGGSGADSLFGGAGADVFRYTAASQSTATAWDTIQDFQVGVDRIDLRGVASEVFLSAFGGNTFVYFNPNGSGGYDGLIIANGVTLTQADVLVTGESAPDLDAKDEALILPGLSDDEPLILPAGLDSKIEVDAEDPLILPAGFEGKAMTDEAPVICLPGDFTPIAGPQRPMLDVSDLGVSTFDGRDPHRFLIENQPVDWIL